MRIRFRFLRVSLGLGLVAVALPALAKFARLWEPVPIDRLLKNVGDYVAAHPKDAAGHYTLGRLHSILFARADEAGEIPTQVIPVGKDRPLPGFPPYDTLLQRPNVAVLNLSVRRRDALVASLRSYHRAVTFAPKEPVYHLGKGWMLEQGLRFAETLDLDFLEPLRKRKPENWRHNAIVSYRTALSLSAEAELQIEHLGPGGDSSIALEAGEGLLRVLSPVASRPSEVDEISKVRSVVKKLASKPRVVTPLLFPLGRARPLAELINPTARVRFDLAGDGRPRRWPWIRPNAAFLVWDPERSGRITSGRQLFGSVTWWVFWRDGYAPLAALDDDRDGWLTKGELQGIGAWRDRNADGRSQPGEILTLGSLGIIGLATVPDGADRASCAHGVRMLGGGTLPTYDWKPRSDAADRSLSRR